LTDRPFESVETISGYANHTIDDYDFVNTPGACPWWRGRPTAQCRGLDVSL